MGLDCSHDAFHGAYSAFNRLRQAVCAAIGGSFPPHWIYGPGGEILRRQNGKTAYVEDADPEFWYAGEGYSRQTHPGLFEFLDHSDCDGEIAPEMCRAVADDLEELLPEIDALGWDVGGHLARDGGLVAVTKRFISGCRQAAERNEPLEFR